MQKIISVKHIGDKNLYHFLEYEGAKVGDQVVINIEDFESIGVVERILGEVDKDKASELPKIKRIATESDVNKYNELLSKAKGSLKDIKKKSLELGLVMKFVCAEYSLDNSKIMITFSSEDRVDFRQLLKELALMFKTRIELKQIGQRDEIKISGGVGPCGEPCCCARFLNDFDHVTVKMAKVQGLSLSPTKINGICGRLMCCLGYESDTYEQILENMPKINSEVTTPNGKGIVVYNDILRERVSVKRQTDAESFVVEDFAIEELSVAGKKLKPLVREEKQPDEAKKSDSTSSEQKANAFDNNLSSKNENKNSYNENRHDNHQEFVKNRENEHREKFNHQNQSSQKSKPDNSKFAMQIIDADAEKVNDVSNSQNSNGSQNPAYSSEHKKNGKFKHYKKNKKKFNV